MSKRDYANIAADAKTAIAETSARLDQAGVRHALIGGLALGAHGYHRATRDVDWLIGDEGVKGKLIVTYTFEAPRRVGPYEIDYFTGDATDPDDRVLVEAVLSQQPDPGMVLVAPPVYVAWSKLKRFSPKDREDIRQLIQHGAIVVSEMRSWLIDNGVSDAGADAAMAKMQRVILEGRAM